MLFSSVQSHISYTNVIIQPQTSWNAHAYTPDLSSTVQCTSPKIFYIQCLGVPYTLISINLLLQATETCSMTPR